MWPPLLPLPECQLPPVSEHSSSKAAAQLCWAFSAADFGFPFFLVSSVCFQVYRTVFCSICPWRQMIKEQIKQMTKMKTLPPISARFQGRPRRGRGESERICSILQLTGHFPLSFHSYPVTPVTRNFYPEGGFCTDTSWQGKTSGWKVPGCEECSFHWEVAAGGWREHPVGAQQPSTKPREGLRRRAWFPAILIAGTRCL